MSELTIEQRFWAKVDKSPGNGPNGDCWIWTGHLNKNGYGQIKYNRKYIGAHRMSFVIQNGEIQNNLFVLHRCDNPSCVNPNHLFLGTQKDNIRDCWNKRRNAINYQIKYGEEHGNAKLSDKEVEDIRKSYIPKHKIFGCKPLAIKYNMSIGGMNKIIHRYNRRHINVGTNS